MLGFDSQFSPWGSAVASERGEVGFCHPILHPILPRGSARRGRAVERAAGRPPRREGPGQAGGIPWNCCWARGARLPAESRAALDATGRGLSSEMGSVDGVNWLFAPIPLGGCPFASVPIFWSHIRWLWARPRRSWVESRTGRRGQGFLRLGLLQTLILSEYLRCLCWGEKCLSGTK